MEKHVVVLLVNGESRGTVTVLYLWTGRNEPGAKSAATVLVPLRSVMQGIGWAVEYTSERDNRTAGIPGADVRLVAPYTLEYARENLDPALRGQRAHPGIIVPLFNEMTLVYSPHWNVGENLKACPLPRRVDGQVYVPLDFLENAVALLVLRLGETMGKEGEYFPGKTGILMSLAKSKRELRVRYLPSAEHTPSARKASSTAE